MLHPHTLVLAPTCAVPGAALRWALQLLLAGLLTLCATGAARAQAASFSNELTDLTLSTGQRLALPAGQWQVLSVYNAVSAEVTWTHTALRNQDPHASVVMLLVRQAAPTQRWAQPACRIDSDNTFLVNGHDSRNDARLSACSRLRIVGSNLAAFRSQADELPGWSRALSLLPSGGPLESEDVLLAESLVLDQAGGGLRIDALLRAEALGTSSSSLMVRAQMGMADRPMAMMAQWLSQLTQASAGAWLVSPAARPVSLDTLLGTQPGVGPADRQVQHALLDPGLPEAVNQRAWALPALLPAGEWAYVAKGSGSGGAIDLLLRQDTDLITPGEGDLLFAGQVDLWSTVLVVRHDARLYSVLTSTQRLDLAPGVQPGTRLSHGQVLVRGTGAGSNTPPVRRQVGWQLVASAQLAPTAFASGWEQAATAVRDLMRSPAIDVQRVLAMAALQLELGQDISADAVAFRVNGQSLPVADARNAALLLPMGRHTVELTSGRIFKSTVQREIDLRNAGTWVQFADLRGRDVGLFNAQFYPNDNRSTQQALTLLEPATTPREQAASAPSAPAPVAAPMASPADTVALAGASTPPSLAVTTPSAQPVPPVSVAPPSAAVDAAQAASPAAGPPAPSPTHTQSEVERLRAQLAQLQAAAAASATSVAPTTNAQPMRPLAPNPRRKALVIGNNAYEHVARLDNAQTDALAIADALQAVGFQVTLGRDLSERRMKEMLRNFRQTVQGGDEVVVYFAGHGVQLANTNYLLPTDIRGQNEEEVKDESIPLQRVLDDMQERRAGFLLAIIDACRDNPFRTATRSANTRGLAPTSAATGQMIIFSAGTGQQALDKLGHNDTDRNGLFTRLLLREIRKPGQPIDRIVRSVRTEVARLAKSVGHEQTPAVYDQTLGDFYFIPAAANLRN